MGSPVAVVTGAGSGIGRALALHLDRRHFDLALCDVDADGLAVTVSRLERAPQSSVVDVADRAGVQAFADAVLTRYGRVDLVINNAGVDLSQTANDTTYEDFEWLMGINFWGVVHGTKAFLPALLAQGEGTIVNLSSIFGVVGWPAQSAYAASKFAVRGYTESLQAELAGTGVRALCVHPGGVATDIVRRSRFYADDLGRTDKAQMAAEFEAVARTSPDDAAAAILRAVERGKRRVLVGRDAQALDRLARLLPEQYWRVIRTMQSGAGRHGLARLVARRGSARSAPSVGGSLEGPGGHDDRVSAEADPVAAQLGVHVAAPRGRLVAEEGLAAEAGAPPGR